MFFFHSVGNDYIIPTDEVIFLRGVAQPPTRYDSMLSLFDKTLFHEADVNI